MTAQRIVRRTPLALRATGASSRLETEAESSVVTVPDGTIVVPTEQPLGRLAALLLEPGSLASVMATPAFEALAVPGVNKPCCVYRVDNIASVPYVMKTGNSR
jgi:hypothetical protein